jgi:hypothetical protein
VVALVAFVCAGCSVGLRVYFDDDESALFEEMREGAGCWSVGPSGESPAVMVDGVVCENGHMIYRPFYWIAARTESRYKLVPELFYARRDLGAKSNLARVHGGPPNGEASIRERTDNGLCGNSIESSRGNSKQSQ